MPRGPTKEPRAVAVPAIKAQVLNLKEFGDLIAMIGQVGVNETIEIFETETRRRLRRLAIGGQDTATVVREMHTLKGAAGTVAAARLAALGRLFEQAAHTGIMPVLGDLKAIEDELDSFLVAVRTRNKGRVAPL